MCYGGILSSLPRVAVCCIVLQCAASVAVCYGGILSSLQRVAVCRIVLQCVAVCGIVLQCVAVCANCAAMIDWHTSDLIL